MMMNEIDMLFNVERTDETVNKASADVVAESNAVDGTVDNNAVEVAAKIDDEILDLLDDDSEPSKDSDVDANNITDEAGDESDKDESNDEDEADNYVSDGPLVKFTTTFSAKQMVRKLNENVLSLDNIIQRSFVWDTPRMSLLIHSILYGFPVSIIWAKRVGVKKSVSYFDILDGKQRITTIQKFIEGKFALTSIPKIMFQGELMDINGMYFKDLPEDMQDTIRDYDFTFYCYDNLTPSQEREMFKRLNNGRPLTAKERSIVNCGDLDTLTKIGEHDFFKSTMTAKALEKRSQISVIMKIYMMLHMDLGDFDFAKDMASVMESTRMTDEEKDEMNTILNRGMEIATALEGKKAIRRKFSMETHFVSLAPFIKRSIDDGISADRMAGFMEYLFGDKTPVSDEYNLACRGGSNKSTAIITRSNELNTAWNDYFHVGEDEECGEVIAEAV